MSPSYLLGYQVVFFSQLSAFIIRLPRSKVVVCSRRTISFAVKMAESRFRLAKTHEEEQLSQERTVPKAESMKTNGRLPLFKDCKISDCKRNYYQRGNEMDC